MIENGHWIGPDPQIEDEMQWGGWPAFYQVEFPSITDSSPFGPFSFFTFYPLPRSLLSCCLLFKYLLNMQGTNARFNGREVCDCFRKDPASDRGNIENRYYYNEEINIRVTFFQWFGLETGHLGHNMTWLNASVPTPLKAEKVGSDDSLTGHEKEEYWQQEQQQPQEEKGALETPITPADATVNRKEHQMGCLPGECNQPPHWTYDIYGFLRKVVPLVQPDVLIFNHGIWGRLPGEYDLVQLSQAAQEAVRKSRGRVIYKTTTAPRYVKETLSRDRSICTCPRA